MSKELRRLERARSRVAVWRRLLALIWVAAIGALTLTLVGMGTLIYALVWGNSADGLSGFGLFSVGAVTLAITIAAIGSTHDGGPYDSAQDQLAEAETAYERAVEMIVRQQRS